MAAIPASRRSVRRTPAADPADVVRCCREFAHASPHADDRHLLAALRLLHASLQSWRRADLEAAARRRVAPPRPPLALGAFARRFVAWLDAHPERANEPLEWQVRQALLDSAE